MERVVLVGSYKQVYILANSMTIADCPFSWETNLFSSQNTFSYLEKYFLSNTLLCSDVYPIMSSEFLVGE